MEKEVGPRAEGLIYVEKKVLPYEKGAWPLRQLSCVDLLQAMGKYVGRICVPQKL